MKIVITGVSGLVGSKLCKYLIKNGHDVIGVGRSDCRVLGLLYYIKLDLSTEKTVEMLHKKIPKGVDIVIHCSAQQPRARFSFNDYCKGNVNATVNVETWAEEVAVSLFITFSTIAFLELPLLDGELLDESACCKPKNFYALSKYTAETYLQLSNVDNNLSTLCLRIPSLVQEEQIGGVINTYWESAIKNSDLEIYDNGEFKRNLIYIDSIVEVIEIALKNVEKFSGFNLYHIGSKDAWPLIKIAQYIYKKLDSRGVVYPVDKKSPVAGHWDIDTHKAEQEFNFRPWTTKKVLDGYIKNMSSKEK